MSTFPADAPIIISKTFTEYTPESIDECLSSDNGFVFKDTEYTAQELLDMRREYYHTSSEPCDENTWISTESYTTCYETGNTRSDSLHLSANATDTMQAMWLAFLRDELQIADD